jgi:hypothetical protein
LQYRVRILQYRVNKSIKEQSCVRKLFCVQALEAAVKVAKREAKAAKNTVLKEELSARLRLLRRLG